MKLITKYALLNLCLFFLVKIEKMYKKSAINTIGSQREINTIKAFTISNCVLDIMIDNANIKEDIREAFPKTTRAIRF